MPTPLLRHMMPQLEEAKCFEIWVKPESGPLTVQQRSPLDAGKTSWECPLEAAEVAQYVKTLYPHMDFLVTGRDENRNMFKVYDTANDPMKTYIVYVNGVEMPKLIQAPNMKAAEKLAKNRYPDPHEAKRKRANPFTDRIPRHNVEVSYTEI